MNNLFQKRIKKNTKITQNHGSLQNNLKIAECVNSKDKIGRSWSRSW